jgi:predicted MFS family arabinose efflux permease
LVRRQNKWIWTPLIVITVATSVLLSRSLDFLRETPLSFSRAYQSPSAVAVAPDGSMAVVENSKMLLTVTDPQGRLRVRVRGGSLDTDAFYYAEHVATDGHSVVVAEVRHAQSSTFVESERIIRYDMDGMRLEVLYAAQYGKGEQPRQLGRIRSLRLTGGQVTFAWVHGTAVGASVCEASGTRELLRVRLKGDDVLRAAYDPAAAKLTFTTKKGLLGQAGADGAIAWLPYGDGVRVPWGVDVTADGTVLVSELISGQVEAITGGGARTLWQGGLTYDVAAVDGGVCFTDGERVIWLDEAGTVLDSASQVALSPGFALRLVLTWASALYLVIVALWLVWRLLRLLRGQPFTEAKRRMFIASGSVLVTVVVVMGFLLSFAQRQMQSQTLGMLSQLAESISATSGAVFGDRLARINALSDYRGEDYTAVRDFMDAFCDASYRSDQNLYYILYRFEGDMLYGVMDYENTTGVRYPYCTLSGTVYGDVARTGKSLRVEGEMNIYGMWSYAVAPVYDGQELMVGLLEIGTNQYGEVVARQALIRGVLTGVLVALMMAMLLFNELTAFGDHLARRKVLRLAGGRRIALGFIRPLIFLVFMADNMDAAYIPQLSAWLGADTAAFLPPALAAALPMSFQLLAIGLSALAAGRVLDRSHPRSVLLGGFALQVAGVLTAIGALISGQYWLLLLAKGIGGVGTGAAVVTCNAMPARTDEPAEQQSLIAGLNVGVITGVVLGSSTGGYVAEYLGYWAAYVGAGLLVLTAAGLTLHSLRGSETLTLTEEDHAGRRGDTLRFLKNPKVFGFLLFIMLPYMLMMYFKDYLFPLFASDLGKTESVIGSVMLLGGALAIVLGDVVAGALIRRVGAWNAVRLSSLVSMYALGLFALNPRFETAVITICLLGIAASFGYASQGVYYNDLIRAGRIGDGKAMGVFSLFDNLGQTSGPLILSALLFMGVAAESGVIAVGAAGCVGLASLLARKGRRRHDR